MKDLLYLPDGLGIAIKDNVFLCRNDKFKFKMLFNKVSSKSIGKLSTTNVK
jgi:hypothetical protein